MSEESATRCECDYEFGQPVDKVLALLRQQRKNELILLPFSILAMVASVLMFPFVWFFAIWLFSGSVVWIGRNVRKLLITRGSLRQLGDRKLAEARLLKG